MENLTICGYNFPNSTNARVAVIVAIEALRDLGWMKGIKQEEFLMLAMKAGYTHETIRMGGTRQYFCPTDDPTLAPISTYGVFFSRVKVGRAYEWHAIRDNCEEALKYKDKIMSEANEEKKKAIDNKVKTVITNLKQLKKFQKGAIIAPRPFKYSSRESLLTPEQLHRSVASSTTPNGGTIDDNCAFFKHEKALVLGNFMDAYVRFDELYHVWREAPAMLGEISEMISEYVSGMIIDSHYAAYRYFKVPYPQVMILGTAKIGYVDPTKFKVVARTDES